MGEQGSTIAAPTHYSWARSQQQHLEADLLQQLHSNNSFQLKLLLEEGSPIEHCENARDHLCE